MTILPSTSLRNQYNEISDLCKKTGEPVYLTKNGKGDLVVMSIEAYEKMMEKLEIREKLDEIKKIRAEGGKGYTLEELKIAMREVLDGEKL